MIDYTILTIISITAFMLSMITIGFVISLSTRIDELRGYVIEIDRYTEVLSKKISNQRNDFNRSLLTAERKEKELDERMNVLQCRLNQDRMQGIINGKITE